MSNFSKAGLQAKAVAWAERDCDTQDREAALRLAEHADLETLQRHFGEMLQFGTAGLRGKVGPGPGCMNRALVRLTTLAVARYLSAQPALEGRAVVIGYDARPNSRDFAEQVGGVLGAAGIRVRFFEQAVPTPLVAFALLWYRAAAAVVITASHNPKEDNGYKLYGSNGVQIVSPADQQIAALMAAAEAPRDIPYLPRAFDPDRSAPGTNPVLPSVFDDYFARLQALRPRHGLSRELAMVYTPLHGVGGASVRRAFFEAGFDNLVSVPEQAAPDGSFPTTPNPNPERAGVLDLATQLATRTSALLVLANDPDADRLAACARMKTGEIRALTGNQLGVLLTDYLLSKDPQPSRGLVVRSIVSTPMADLVAQHWGARSEVTLTGFKWLWNAALELTSSGALHPVIAFEEALGYSLGDLVRDKDGVSAALICAEMAAELDAAGGSLFGKLEQLYRQHGLWVSVQLAVRREPPRGLVEIEQAFERLASSPPTVVRGLEVVRVTDYRRGAATRPRWLPAAAVLELGFAGGGRALVRPSGTEPLLKIYVDWVAPLSDADDAAAVEQVLQREASAVADELRRYAGI